MKDILQEIIAHKRKEVQSLRQQQPFEELQKEYLQRKAEDSLHQTRSMKEALSGSSTGIISEFKRRSPSKGWIHQNADIASIVRGYEEAGATALSVLTDTSYFGGCAADLRKARASVRLPILRKDFIVDEYQILEARLWGADAILLIAAALSQEECERLARKAHEVGLEVLLELHHENELPSVSCNPDMIGINNRNLGSFHTDVNHSFQMISKLPHDAVCVSESGIHAPETVLALRRAGFKGFLIGENFMQHPAPQKELKSFIEKLNE